MKNPATRPQVPRLIEPNQLGISVRERTWSHHLCERRPLSVPGDPSHPVALDRALCRAPPHCDTVVLQIRHLHFRGRVDALQGREEEEKDEGGPKREDAQSLEMGGMDAFCN